MYVSTLTFQQVIFALLLCSIHQSLSKPIVDPALRPNDFGSSPSEHMVAQFDDPNQREEADEFMRSNGVTKDEIEEYHRISKFIFLGF